jgi:hypothetical protein
LRESKGEKERDLRAIYRGQIHAEGIRVMPRTIGDWRGSPAGRGELPEEGDDGWTPISVRERGSSYRFGTERVWAMGLILDWVEWLPCGLFLFLFHFLF